MLKLTPTSLFIHVWAVTPGGKNGKNINISGNRPQLPRCDGAPAVTDVALLPSSGSGSVPFLPRAVAVAVRARRSVGESPGQPWQVLDPGLGVVHW